MSATAERAQTDGTATELYRRSTMNPSLTCDRLAWQAYADACLEHDDSHARRAAEELRTVDLPLQRDAETD